MRILLLEDEDLSARQTSETLDRVLGPNDITIATNLQDAKALLDAGAFDLFVCDLRVPSAMGLLDAHEDFGRTAYSHARSTYPGLPVIFLSGRATTRNTAREISGGGLAEIMGMPESPLTRLADKGSDDFEEFLEEIRAGSVRLQSCPVGGDPVDSMFARAAQSYGVTLGSDGAQIRLTEGLSGSRVGIVTYSVPGHPPASVLLKVDRLARVDQEGSRYGQFVSNRLAAGTFAPQIKILRAGLQSDGALISNLAAPFSETLFAHLTARPSFDPIADLKSSFSPWSSPVEVRTMTVGELRRLSISDASLRSLSTFSSDLCDADHISLEISFRLEHGDLHGENILIDPGGRPLLIDFADVGVLPASTDPVALELSLLAHPKSPLQSKWPDGSQLRGWSDLDSFVLGSPYEGLIRSTRAWALTGTSRQQHLAVALAQALWLMKHSGPSADRMKQVAQGIVQELMKVPMNGQATNHGLG